MISEDEVEKALHWLLDNSGAIGDAKADQIRTQRMTKHIKALEMKRHAGTVGAQEREAYASQNYLEALEKEARAAGHYETMLSLRGGKEMTIEAWRSMAANHRNARI